APTITRVMHMHLTEAPPAVSTCRSAAPVELDAIIQKVLAKDPNDRYQSARELSDALGLIEAVETLERASPNARRSLTPPDLTAVPAPYGSTPSSFKRVLVAAGAVAAVVIAALVVTPDRNAEPVAPPPGQLG